MSDCSLLKLSINNEQSAMFHDWLFIIKTEYFVFHKYKVNTIETASQLSAKAVSIHIQATF